MAFPNAFFRSLILQSCLTLALLSAGCHTPPCGDCPNGTVCELDGTCRALGPRSRMGFTRAERLRPVEWGSTRSDRRTETAQGLDELLLGGSLDGTVHFSFDLPEGEVVAAVLTIYPAPRGAHTSTPQTLRAYRTTEIGSHVSRAVPPRRIGRFGASRRVAARANRPLRIDVTDLVRDVAGEERVHLALDARRSDGLAWRIASPTAENDELHPRLDLRLR